MKKFTKRIALAVLCLWMLSFPVSAAEELVPVGEVIGLELRDGTVMVAGFDPRIGEPARQAGLQVGDCIIKMDGAAIASADDIRQALSRAQGDVQVVVTRGGREQCLTLTPQICAEGRKLGIYLRQGITGIGTVTWYDPDTGSFGTLGHGVNGTDGELLKLTRGSAYRAGVMAVKKGRSGEPGQLMGTVGSGEAIGVLNKNTARGVFGVSEEGWDGQALPVASADEIRTGKAVIRSTVCDEGVREYSVEILKIYPKSRENGRNLLLKVTDPALLEATGGIVQGMSGSPIIQDGKLIGAVTHVCVNL